MNGLVLKLKLYPRLVQSAKGNFKSSQLISLFQLFCPPLQDLQFLTLMLVNNPAGGC